MSILSRLSYAVSACCPLNCAARCVTGLLMVASVTVIGITGCGQKGALYLVDTSGQTATVETSSAVLASGSQPQDTAFGNLDDTDYDKTRYLERQQILPAASEDPNDY